jgi:DNA (cytosine-5)-methyltransferase 1
MNIGSLFSGGGGGDLGFINAGHNIVFGCEIDPRARSVFRYHHPDIPIYYDVQEVTHDRLKADGVPFPDLIMGGSPCQDLSVAGKRAGLGGERSGLFHEQCRIADELGSAWLVWENVAGAFSSNKGEDFAAVLGGLTGNTPAVPKRGWRNAGVCVGPKRVAVWRVLDAQNFGVPQRRRRVFVVAGPRTLARRVVEVLLEPESGNRDTPTRQKAQQDSSASSACGADTPKSMNDAPFAAFDSTWSGRYALNNTGDVSPTLKVGGGGAPPAIAIGHNPVVRKLTPLECERLMGWPDNYTRFGTNDIGELVLVSDSGRYKVCGNGIVAPVTEWIANRLPKEGEL